MTAFKTRRGVWQSFPPNFFNLTMTYRSDSDIHVPYDRFIPTDEDVPGTLRLDVSARLTASLNALLRRKQVRLLVERRGRRHCKEDENGHSVRWQLLQR